MGGDQGAGDIGVGAVGALAIAEQRPGVGGGGDQHELRAAQGQVPGEFGELRLVAIEQAHADPVHRLHRERLAFLWMEIARAPAELLIGAPEVGLAVVAQQGAIGSEQGDGVVEALLAGHPGPLGVGAGHRQAMAAGGGGDPLQAGAIHRLGQASG